MKTSRRSLLMAMAGAGAAASPVWASARAGDFAVPKDVVLLNNAGTHPLPRVAAQAMSDYLTGKAEGGFNPHFRLFQALPGPRAQFAQLINADPEEVALVQSTLMAENMVVSGLGVPGGRGNVVTDALHYDGALYLYRSLESRALEVRIAPARDGGIAIEDLARLIDENTRLVSVSLISSINGFTHDLKAICEIAHAKGALVYADIIQAVGAVPVDVKATNVDFAGCGSYKWLMGDCGAGFIYVRKDLLGKAISREHWGYLQCDELEQKPFGAPTSSDWPVRFKRAPGAVGYFEVGTPAFGVLTGLEKSMALAQELGVPAIAAHIAGLIEPLHHPLLRGWPHDVPRPQRARQGLGRPRPVRQRVGQAALSLDQVEAASSVGRGAYSYIWTFRRFKHFVRRRSEHGDCPNLLIERVFLPIIRCDPNSAAAQLSRQSSPQNN